jgi:hypothetical protein
MHRWLTCDFQVMATDINGVINTVGTWCHCLCHNVPFQVFGLFETLRISSVREWIAYLCFLVVQLYKDHLSSPICLTKNCFKLWLFIQEVNWLFKIQYYSQLNLPGNIIDITFWFHEYFSQLNLYDSTIEIVLCSFE